MNIHYGYKVVEASNQGYKSSSVPYRFKHLKVRYRLNEWTEPKKGALAVFSNYKDAIRFVARIDLSLKLHACQYIVHRGKAPYKSYLPGKVFASKVKLTRWYGE